MENIYEFLNCKKNIFKFKNSKLHKLTLIILLTGAPSSKTQSFPQNIFLLNFKSLDKFLSFARKIIH